jgi:hypothetical protein
MLRSALLALGIAAALAGPAAADPPGAPLSTWIPDGEVKAVAVSGQTAYVGGNFGRIAPYTGGSARIDSSTAQAKAPWPQVAGTVHAVAFDGLGGWYLGGDFSTVAGSPHQNLAHVRADGTLDEAWLGATNGVVRALAANGSNVFAGGTFSIANGVGRDNLAAFDPGTGALQTINPGVSGTPSHFCTGPGFDDSVFSLALSGSTLYVSGIFNSAHGSNPLGVTRNGAAAFSIAGGTATVTGFDPNMLTGGMSPTLQPVYSVVADTSNHVYVGGCLLSVNGGAAGRNGVARVDATSGAVDASWNPGVTCCGSQVQTIALGQNALYVSAFSTPGSRDVAALSLMDATVTAAFDPPMHTSSAQVRAIVPAGPTLYLAGTFKSDDGSRTNLAAVNPITGAFLPWLPDGAGRINALGAAGTDVVAGGAFETYGGVPRRDLAAIDLTTGLPTAFHAPIDEQLAGFSSVDSLAVGDGVLWAAGGFATTGPSPLAGLAAFDPQSGAQTTFNLGLNSGGAVHALAASGSTVYLGGNFTTIGGTPRRNAALIQHVPGDQGEVLRFDADLNGDVTALALAGDTLYLGGLFDRINTTGVGAVRNRLGAVDSTSGDVLPFDPNVDGRVRALQVDGGTLFAGGDFTTVNGSEARQRLAALDRLTGAARTWRADADAPVNALALHGRTLFAGGPFTQLGAATRPGIAAIDADSAAVADWPPSEFTTDPISGGTPQPTVPVTHALATGGSTGLIAGGDFRLTAPGLRAIHLAAFRLPPLAPQPPTATAGDGQATVAFTPPAGDGGSPITSFTVTASPGGRTASGSGGPLTITGLDNGTSYTFTVTASNTVGTGPPSLPSNAVTPQGPGGGGGGDTTKPVLRSFTATRKRFRVGPRRTPANGTATAAAKRKRAKPGTTLKLNLSEAAKVRFAVLLKTSGRKVGKACRKPTRKNRRRKRCTRLVAKGSFTRSARKGRSKVTFSGRIGKRALKRGRYVMRATPTDAAGNRGSRRSLSFTIVR